MAEQQPGTEHQPDTSQPTRSLPFLKSTFNKLRKLVTRQKSITDSTNPPNIYNPLPADNYFRLLKIYPGRGTDAIQCKLQPVAIDHVVDGYEAISYVWGDPTITETITCNGVQVAITTNLADALRSFRLPKSRRVVWADAICINQQDMEERSSQVKMMDQVYAKAKGVLAWLGRDSDGIAEECFSHLSSTNEFLDDHYWRHGSDFRTLPPLPDPLPFCHKRRCWLHVHTLLELPYFERVWVVQEVALAKECELWWGTAHLSIAHVFEFACWYWRKLEFRSVPDLMYSSLHIATGLLLRLFIDVHAYYETKKTWRYSLPLIKEQSSAQRQGLFLDILGIAQFMKATDSRDHIYAFLGSPLAKKENGKSLVEPSYSLSVEDVYFEAACALLQNNREASWLLGYVVHPLMDLSSPSWVPTWNHFYQQTQLSHPSRWYRAGGSHQVFHTNVDRGFKTLRVVGCIFDKIAWLSEIIEYRNLRFTPHLWTHELRATGQSLIDVLWDSVSAFRAVDEDDFTLTMVCEYSTSKTVSVDMDAHRENFALYRRHVRAMMLAPDDREIRNASGHYKLLRLEDELRNCNKRRLAVTEQGRLALVPSATRIGDVCCVILGASTPFVLTREGEQMNRIVGPCYVRGCMNGEIIEKIQQGVLEKETITIT